MKEWLSAVGINPSERGPMAVEFWIKTPRVWSARGESTGCAIDERGGRVPEGDRGASGSGRCDPSPDK